MSLLHQIGLTLIPGVGDLLIRNLISYCGSAEAVFHQPKSKLLKIPGIGNKIAEEVLNITVLKRAEQEIKFIEKHKITTHFFTDKSYPKRLKECNDSPALLYYKGNADLNHTRMISIIGTRKATDYGKQICADFIAELSILNVLIVSGLAYGIDICSHKEALKNSLPTIGVLGHGLDRIYPSAHRPVAEKMVENGGLITEFISQTNPDRENFPKRNRIIAGLADATIVVEGQITGGALITAEIANSYNRDVFAFPGRITDEYSVGCNEMIRRNKAALINSASHFIEMMGWEQEKLSKNPQVKLFADLSTEEHQLLDILKSSETTHIDDLVYSSGFTQSKLAALLLSLEFKMVIKSLPGKVYKLIG